MPSRPSLPTMQPSSRQELVDAAADCDDELMEKVLMDEEFSVEELKAALRKGVIACKDLNLVFVGSAYKNKGVQELLDAVVDYLPAPLDVPPSRAPTPRLARKTREADPKGPFSALAFKIMTDPFVGKLTYLRVYSGSLDSGFLRGQCYQGQEGAHWPPAADALQPASHDDTCSAGDIVAVVGLKNTTTGDTLCTEGASYHPRVHGVPRSCYRHCRRAQDQG